MKWQAIEIAFCFRGASGTQEGIMQSNYGKRSGAYWARGFAALWAALAAAAGGSALAAPVETVLYSFAGGHSDGRRPEAGLIADSSGNLYGTTEFGGASNVGVVFKLSPGGTETVLYSFMGGSDGSFPGTSGLIADSSGNLYGTTEEGAMFDEGVVFKVSPSGTETVLYAFKGFPSDGQGPAGLIADSNGNLYGTTQVGGTRVVFCPSGCGTVFKLSPGGTETVLYAFSSFGDGAHP
jgi:uncharacterized repeat protein (TIGR03803 family)